MEVSVSFIPQQLCPEAIIQGAHCIGGWVYFIVGLDVMENGNISCPSLRDQLWFLGHQPLSLVTILAGLSWLTL
jgi:hypothetical protein